MIYLTQTTCGRIHTFGSYILPSLVISRQYKWILLQNDGCISGLYYKNVNSVRTIMRLGAIGDGTTARAAPLHLSTIIAIFLPLWLGAQMPDFSYPSPS